jgi:hypothetical protein
MKRIILALALLGGCDYHADDWATCMAIGSPLIHCTAPIAPPPQAEPYMVVVGANGQTEKRVLPRAPTTSGALQPPGVETDSHGRLLGWAAVTFDPKNRADYEVVSKGMWSKNDCEFFWSRMTAYPTPQGNEKGCWQYTNH